MDNRIIVGYDPTNHNITNEFLYDTNDWDLIELDYNLNLLELQSWWDKMGEHFSNLKFQFTKKTANKLEIERSKKMVEEGYCGYYCGPIDGLTLAWPIERYEPLPPSVQCNLELFPEVNRKTFITDAKILSKFNFGYFKELVEFLGVGAFRKAIVTIHHPGMKILQHRDSKDLKIHIPIYSNENAFFHFGKDRDRKYHMKIGKMYILNTADWHGTSNDTLDGYKIHIITRVDRDLIQKIIGLSNQ